MQWQQFVRTLNHRDQATLVAALADGLMYTRLASQVATDNGEVADAIRHIDTALACLTRARQALTQPPVNDHVIWALAHFR